jgi:hypothetical protein
VMVDQADSFMHKREASNRAPTNASRQPFWTFRSFAFSDLAFAAASWFCCWSSNWLSSLVRARTLSRSCSVAIFAANSLIRWRLRSLSILGFTQNFQNGEQCIRHPVNRQLHFRLNSLSNPQISPMCTQYDSIPSPARATFAIRR